MLRSAVQAVRAVDLKAELGGNFDLISERRESFPDEFLVDVGTVYFRGVEERDTSFISVATPDKYLPSPWYAGFRDIRAI